MTSPLLCAPKHPAASPGRIAGAELAEAVRRRAAELIALRGRSGRIEDEARGIVIVAGGARIFTNAYVLLSVLRRTLNCLLPIEVWHFGRQELSASMAAAVAEFEVRLIDAQAIIERTGVAIHDGWQLKSLALLWSRFSEVLMLDADQVPVTEPSFIFDWPEFREHGAVFWPDIVQISEQNPVWSLLGLPPETITSVESGQLLVDTRRHEHSLALALALNEEAETLYRLIYGDKDTFLLAWRLTGARPTMVPHVPFVDERCLVQRDFGGAPLFQHRTGSKWSYSGDQWRHSSFIHESACLAAIEELRRRWNGRVFNPPARAAQARATEARLTELGRFRLECIGSAAEPLELLSHCEFGEGRSYDRQNWFVMDPAHSSSQPVLCFRDADRITYRFEQRAPGLWEGTRLRLPGGEVSLRAHHSAPRRIESDSAGLVDEFLSAGGFWYGPHTDADVTRSLALLARVEAGVPERLAAIAGETRDEEAAGRLRRMADRIAAAARFGDPERWKEMDVIGKGYARRRASAF